MRVTSEGPTRITKATIDRAWRKRAPGHRLILRDLDCRGLALIVNETTMRWEFAYRPRGMDTATGRRWPNRTVTLGNPASHSPDDARAEANRLKGEAAAGSDPAVAKKKREAEERRKRGTTLRRLLDDYTKALPRREKMRGPGRPTDSYVRDELAQVQFALADMDVAAMPAADLGNTELRKLLDGGTNGAAGIRARFGALSRFLDWCQDAGHIKANPCDMIARSRRPKAPKSRSHRLTPAELARLWEAAERLREPVWRDLARFLIAVPCRRGEAARMEWSHLDLDKAAWSQPGHMTKNGDPHQLHLPALALEVLASRRRAAAEALGGSDPVKVARILAMGQPRAGLVFPAPVSGGAVDTFSDIRAALINATGPQEGEDGPPPLDGWTWHDFRRSFASALGDAEFFEAAADAVFNHRQSATRGGVMGVYQRSNRQPEQVRAMELWGRLLRAALDGGEADAKVVPMAARAG